MSDWGTARLLAVTPVIGAATAYRVGVGHLRFWSEQTPALTNLLLEAWEPTAGAPEAAEKFRARLIAAARESTQLALREIERGIDDVDAWAAPSPTTHPSPAASGRRGGVRPPQASGRR